MAKMDFLFDLLSYRDRGRVQRAREPLLSPHHLHLSTALGKSLVEPDLIFFFFKSRSQYHYLDSKYDALSSVCVEKGDEAIMGVSFTMISLLREWHPRPGMVSNVFLSGSIRPVDQHWSWIFYLTAPSQHCTAMLQIWQKHSNFYLFKNCSQNARARKWNKFYITVAQK